MRLWRISNGAIHIFTVIGVIRMSTYTCNKTKDEISEYTWDDLCKRADGAACGEPSLKAKDNARYSVRDFAMDHGYLDLEETDCPEEEVERYCEEFGILFDENGNIVRSRLELAEDFVEAIKMLGNKPDNLENLAYYLSKHFDV